MSLSPLPVEEAARLLGTTSAAIRKRIKRGTLTATKGEDGRWYVILPDDAGQPTGQPAARPGDVTPDSLPGSLASRVTVLEAEKALLVQQIEDTRADRDRWHTAYQAAQEQARDDLRETRRLALLYAPQRKQKELAALLHLAPDDLPASRPASRWWAVLAVLLLAAVAAAVWYVFLR